MFADGLLAASPVVDKEQQSAGGMPDAGVSARGGPAAPAGTATAGTAATDAAGHATILKAMLDKVMERRNQLQMLTLT